MKHPAGRRAAVCLVFTVTALSGCALLVDFEGYEGDSGAGGFASGAGGESATSAGGPTSGATSGATTGGGGAESSSSGQGSSTAQGTSSVASTSSTSSSTATTSSGSTTCGGPSDCPTFPSDDACRTTTCTAGVCGLSFAAAGTPVGAQVAGDCQIVGCDGAGNVVGGLPAPADLPNDGNGCTTDTCSGATPVFTPVGDGTACSDGLFCNGSDTCVAGLCSQHAGNPCIGGEPDSDCSDGCSEATLDCTAITPFAICKVGNDFGECDAGGVCMFF